jgi:hypothetical protein
MRTKYTLQAVAASAVMLSPIAVQASAIDIGFSFTGSLGGIVTGVLYFNADTGRLDPTEVEILTTPWGSLLNPPFYIVPTHQIGVFTLSNGKIEGGGGSFGRVTSRYTSGLIRNVLLNSAGEYEQLFIRIHATPGSFIPYSTFTSRSGALSYSYPPSAPEPSSIALLGAGIVGIASFSRRRSRKARNARAERTDSLTA